MSTTLPVSSAFDALRSLRVFRAGQYLRTERYFRLSAAPSARELSGLTPTQRLELTTAARINRAHYMPFCAVCGDEVTHGDGGLPTWQHTTAGADHVPTQASEPDSYTAHPHGLAYVVWLGDHVAAWIRNDGTVTHLDVPTAPQRLRLLILDALRDHTREYLDITRYTV